MPCVDNHNNYPCIRQRNRDWCIPASIENVMKYYQPNIALNQRQIVHIYTQNHSFGTISFENISQELRPIFGHQWNFDPRTWANNTQFFNYVQACINNSNPVIISMHLPGGIGAHMYTVICVNSKFFRVFDTGYLPIPIDIKKDFILNHLAPSKGMECTPKMIQLVKQQKYHRGIIWEKREEDIQETSNCP